MNALKQSRTSGNWFPEHSTLLPFSFSQPSFLTVELSVIRRHVEREMLSTCIEYSDLSSEVIDGFPCKWNDLPSLPYDVSLPIEELFYVGSGKSQGEKNYQDGACPYISSGDPNNSIVRLVQGVDDEIYCDGGITVTCFRRPLIDIRP